MPTHNFMTVTQVANELDLHKNTILKLIGDGRLQAINVGKRWLIERSELDMLIVIREEGSTRPTIVRKPDDEPAPKKKRRGKKAA